MPKYDVKLQLDDAEHQIHLEVYQQVISKEAQTEEPMILDSDDDQDEMVEEEETIVEEVEEHWRGPAVILVP